MPTTPSCPSGRIDASHADSDQVLSNVSEISFNFEFLALVHSVEIPDFEWDHYPSSPTFSNPSKSVSFYDSSNNPPSENQVSPFQRWTRSRRPVTKKNWGCKSSPISGQEVNQDSDEELEPVDDKKADPDNKPNVTRKLKMQIPLNKFKNLTALKGLMLPLAMMNPRLHFHCQD